MYLHRENRNGSNDARLGDARGIGAMKIGKLTVAALAAICLWGVRCGRAADSPVIARVGKAALTLRDLQESVPPEYRGLITREQHINYVKQWIDQELLYQAALSQGLAREPALRNRMEKIKRDLLCAEMLARNAAWEDLQISEDEIRRYYEKNRETFIRARDAARYVEILVDDLKTAWKVREMVTADNFLSLAARYSKLPAQDPRDAPWVAVDSLPAAHADAVRQIRIGGTSQPVKVDGGFALVRVLDKQPAGGLCSIDEVRADIVNALSSKLQKSETERLLSQLRQKMVVTFNFEAIPPDAPASAQRDSSAGAGE